MQRLQIVFLALLLMLYPLSAIPAEEPSQDSQVVKSESVDVAAKLNTIATKKSDLQKKIAETPLKAGHTEGEENRKITEHIQKVTEIYNTLLLVYNQLETQWKHHEELKNAKLQIKTDLNDLLTKGLREENPESFFLLETVRDELNASQMREEIFRSSLLAKQQSVVDAKKTFEKRESERRSAKEILDNSASETMKPELTRNYNLTLLKSQLAHENLQLQELERDNQTLDNEIFQTRMVVLAEKLTRLEKNAVFSQTDLEEQLKILSAEEIQLNRTLDSVRIKLEIAERDLSDVRRRFDRSESPTLTLREGIESARLLRETFQQQVTFLGESLLRLSLSNKYWNQRYHVINGSASIDDMNQWNEEAQKDLSQLNLMVRLQYDGITQPHQKIVTLQTKLDTVKDKDKELAIEIRGQIKSLEMQISDFQSSIAHIETTRRLCEKLIHDIGFSTSENALYVWGAKLKNLALRIWEYELTSVDDQPITINKVVVGIILIIVGIYLAGVISRLIGRKVLQQFGVHESGAHAIQSVIFYVLIVMTVLLALHLVAVPLTWFTILGGALAIGVGFGSQNIVNNFISGMILLVERPIKVRDLIQINDIYGNVVHIGPRSTRVKTGDNLEIIVPNSSFLENNVTNWTLSDAKMRTHVTVGVVYGSSPREVTRLLKRAVAEHGKIFDKPEPFVLFTDFGDNALMFEIHFWIQENSHTALRKIRSDVRYTIEQLFTASGIIIAFPQRDVHLNMTHPLQVQMLNPLVNDSERLSLDERKQVERTKLLRQVELFESLSLEEVDQLARQLSERHCGAGNDVVRQGQEGTSLFIIVEGLLEVKIEVNGVITTIGKMLVPGQFFGEMSLLTGAPRVATVTAITDATLYEMSHEVLEPILKERPVVAQNLSHILAKRKTTIDETMQKSNERETPSQWKLATDLRRRMHTFFSLKENNQQNSE